MTYKNSISPTKAASLRSIIDSLRKGEMHHSDISDMLGFAPNAVRKYANTLLDMKVMVVDRHIGETPRTKGHAVYRLGAESDVDGFLKYLAAYTQTPQQFVKREKPVEKPAAHDPLMATFYGLRGAA